MRSILIVIFLAATSVAAMFSESLKYDAEPVCAQKNTAFKTGERVTYKAGYKWGLISVNAGEAIFTVDTSRFEDKPSIHFVSEGRTYKAYDPFFKVRDRFETYSAIDDLRPYRYIRNTSEGGYNVFNDNVFDYENGLTYVVRDHVKNINRLDTMPIKGCTYDALSMIYNARSIDFEKYEPGAQIPISIFLDEDVYELEIRYLRKEVVKWKGQKYRCVLFSPSLVSGTIFKEGDEMKVWITDDANRIPLIVESPLIVGKVRAVVKEWENLRHPITSLVAD
ncbi:MAG: hypothetical protein ACI9P8_001613 [Bacteroidia bacterium]|jgi:hypothetical protein